MLRELLSLMNEEKEALISNNGLSIANIVEHKIEIINSLEALENESQETDEEIQSLVEKIKEIQETNLLLTKQALKFQENLIESIAANISSVAETYSQKGGYTKQPQDINFIDQKV
jgi:NADH:ubiquinone oxidoreductase subunit E